MVYFSFLIYWKIKECKVLVEDIRLWLAVGVEASKPQGRILLGLSRRRRGFVSLCGHISLIPLKQFFEYRIIYYKNHLNSSKKILPKIEALSLDLPEILDIKGIGILDRSGLFVSLKKE